MSRPSAIGALLALIAAASLQASAQTQPPPAPAQPGQPPAARRPPATPPATPTRPATAPAPVQLPEPPIPAQHIAQAGIPQCIPAIDQIARGALTAPYNAQSTWNQSNPALHVFQSIAGIKNPRNNPASGLVALVAAPLTSERCDVVAMEVYPLAGACPDVQKIMTKGGEVETALEDLKVITDPQRRRLILIPGYANTCVAVSVNSFFGPP